MQEEQGWQQTQEQQEADVENEEQLRKSLLPLDPLACVGLVGGPEVSGDQCYHFLEMCAPATLGALSCPWCVCGPSCLTTLV
eukprot:g36479.t1